MAMTTEEPKVTEQSAAITGNMTDSEDEDESVESGEDEPEDPDSEFTKFTRLIWNHLSDLLGTMTFTPTSNV
jgi:TATA-binding protein-associated factor Taf7